MTKNNKKLNFETVFKMLEEEGSSFAIATVIRTMSSTAAKPGMKAIISHEGQILSGWLGGSCVTTAVCHSSGGDRCTAQFLPRTRRSCETASPRQIVAASATARAGNRRFGSLSAPRAHTKVPYKTNLQRKTPMALNRPGRPGQLLRPSSTDVRPALLR